MTGLIIALVVSVILNIVLLVLLKLTELGIKVLYAYLEKNDFKLPTEEDILQAVDDYFEEKYHVKTKKW